MKKTIKIFLTYLKRKRSTGEIYVGRTSGEANEITDESIQKILEKRDNYHQMNKAGYDKAVLDKVSTNSDAIRGREDMQIEKAKKEGISGNKYRGISLRNKKRKKYLKAAIAAFGTLSVILAWYIITS